MKNPTKKKQQAHFGQLYRDHKGTPMEVSSESASHKRTRFKLITEIAQDDNHFSIHDVGMGLADLYPYCLERFAEQEFEYSGSEILEEYVREARKRYPSVSFFYRDIAEQLPEHQYDWVVLSGVFHQRRDSTIPEWEQFMAALLKNSFQMARKGIAFNLISPFVDFYQTEVYYSNMPKWIQFIVDNLSRFFYVKHDYPLFEYTVYVYHQDHIKRIHQQPEFQKYFRNRS